MGGPQLGLSLHSTVVTINHWDAPVDKNEELVPSMMNASRQAIQTVKETESDFAIFEPVMITKVYVNSNDLGEVSHDLTQRCQAVILAVEDESVQDTEIADWTAEVVEKTYVPPDYTISQTKGRNEDFANKKIIIAETPLKEMIGYLSKLRALTQGRATFDMSFIGMRRVTGSRADSITRG